MRIRGWGRDLNRVQKERVVGRPQMSPIGSNHGIPPHPEIRAAFITTTPGEQAERLSMQGTVEEWRALRDLISEVLRFVGAES